MQPESIELSCQLSGVLLNGFVSLFQADKDTRHVSLITAYLSYSTSWSSDRCDVVSRDRTKGGSRMKAWQGLTHAAVVTISVWLCRFTIFEALQWWTGLIPSDGLLLGSLILTAGVASSPIITQHFSHIQVQLLYLLSLS